MLGHAYTILDADNQYDVKTANVLISSMQSAQQEISIELMQLAASASDRVQEKSDTYNPLVGSTI